MSVTEQMETMKHLFAAVIFTAILDVSRGQTTTFAPKSQCGIRALKCFTDRQALMNSKVDVIDLLSACHIFSTVFVCMDGLDNCSNDADYQEVRQNVIDSEDDVCGPEGTIKSCGSFSQGCYDEMDAAMKETMAKNLSAACPVITKFAVCLQNVLRNFRCSPRLSVKLNHFVQMLDSQKQIGGCDGPCVQAIEMCTVNATSLPANLSILNMDLTTYCKSALGSYNCLNNLTQTSVCSSSSPSSGEIDQNSYLQMLMQYALAAVGDVCNKDGSTSACVTDLMQCTNELPGVTDGSEAAASCQAMSAFLECISQLPCMTTLAPMVANLRKTLETDETKDECPSVGSCNERFARCGLQDQLLDNITQSDKNTVCKTVKSGITCFDFVKNDPYCINEKNYFATEEQDLRRLITIRCGDAGGNIPGDDSACTQSITNCKNMTHLPASQSVFDLDVTTYCHKGSLLMHTDIFINATVSSCTRRISSQCMNSVAPARNPLNANKAYSCFNNLTQSSACSGSSNGINASEFLQAEKDDTLSKVGNVCNQDGSTSACVSDLDLCHDDLTGINNASDTNTQCQAISTFLECSSKLPCGTTLAPLIENYKKTLENEETKKLCPSVGTCDERFAKCGQLEQELFNKTEPNKDTFCKKVRSCFDFVKNDPNCINEKISFSNEEQDVNDIISAQCRGGASRLPSFTLFVISLMLCLKQCC